MTTTTGFNTGAPVFSPEFSDMIDRCVDLFKLDIVQGLAFDQEPNLLAARGLAANPSQLGAIVARRLARGKPAASGDGSPPPRAPSRRSTAPRSAPSPAATTSISRRPSR